MSRQIKFRVWDKEKRRFISSNYFAIGLDGTLIQHNICYNNDPDDTWDDSWNEELDEDKYVIEQFTDLLDSEGKEIYEGDILKFNNLHYEVLWRDYKWVATCPNYNRHHWPTFDPFCRAKMAEIIGNIHQNPELLAA